MDRLYDNKNRLTDQGREISEKFISLVREFFDKHDNVCPRDLSHVLVTDVWEMEIISVLTKQDKEEIAAVLETFQPACQLF